MIWGFAGIFCLYALTLTIRNDFTMGTLLIWLISGLFAAYGLFHGKIDAFLKTRPGHIVAAIFLTGLAVYSALFLFVALSGYRHTAEGDEAAIIILGAGLQGEEVSDVLHRRLEAGLTEWRQNPDAVIVVTGGQGPQEAIPEALAMQRWLLAHGVPGESILVEDKSTSTEENLLFSRALLEEAGYSAAQPISVVTNAFHCYRGGVYAGKAGFEAVRTVPATMNLTTLLPSYMREVLAVLDLWVFKR